MLSIMPSHSKFFLRHSNCPSAGICFDSNLLALYVLMICLSDVIVVDFFVFYDLSHSKVQQLGQMEKQLKQQLEQHLSQLE